MDLFFGMHYSSQHEVYNYMCCCKVPDGILLYLGLLSTAIYIGGRGEGARQR